MVFNNLLGSGWGTTFPAYTGTAVSRPHQSNQKIEIEMNFNKLSGRNEEKLINIQENIQMFFYVI